MSRYKQKKATKYSPVVIGIVIIFIALVVWWFLNRDGESDVITRPVEIPKENKLQGFDGEKLLINETEKNNADNSLDKKNISTAEENDAEFLKAKPKVVELGNSDESFREAVVNVSKNFGGWFETKDSITKYITLIHDISQNQIIAKNRVFLHIPKNGIAKQDSQGLYLTQKGYKRYDHFANAVASINAQKGLDLYLTFKPLFNKVYKKFSYPNAYKVEDIFLKAAANVIKAPVVEGRIALLKHSIFYKFSDKKLEALSDVEKQMLRMGPENTKKIQAKLRQLVEVISELNE